MTGREVLAFGLHGTLADPIAISAELGRVLGGWRGRVLAAEAAGVLVPAHGDGPVKGLPDLTMPAVDRLPAALAGSRRAGQAAPLIAAG